MNIKSPVGNFSEILATVSRSADQYEAKLRKSEAMTRAALIDPVLRALGWDIANPNMVELEPYYQSTKLDYALLDCKGQFRIIVEAKTLGSNLNEDRIFTTLISYGITHKIPTLVLTDGLIWKLFKIEIFDQIEPIVFDLNQHPLAKCAQFLISNLDATLYWYEETRTPVMPAPTQPPPAPPTIKPVPPDNSNATIPGAIAAKDFIPLSKLDQNLTGKKPPTILRLPDGSIQPLNSWRDILFHCIRFVLTHNPNLTFPILDKAGKKCILIDYQKMNQKGVIVKEKYLGKDVFVFLNFDSNHTVANAVHILNRLPPQALIVAPAVAFN